MITATSRADSDREAAKSLFQPTAGDTTGGATLVQVADDGVPVTTSLIIAAETGNQHKNVLGLIRDNLADLNDAAPTTGWSRLKRELQVRARNPTVVASAQAEHLVTMLTECIKGRLMTPRLLCPIGLSTWARLLLPVTDILEYDVKAGTHYALVRTGSDASRGGAPVANSSSRRG